MRPGKFGGAIILRWRDSTWWEVEQSFSYTTNSGARILIPKGYMTDLGSIPRLFWRILHRSEFAPAYIVHDWLVENRIGHWKESARILSESIYTLTGGDATLKRFLIYRSVLLYGWLRKK